MHRARICARRTVTAMGMGARARGRPTVCLEGRGCVGQAHDTPWRASASSVSASVREYDVRMYDACGAPFQGQKGHPRGLHRGSEQAPSWQARARAHERREPRAAPARIGACECARKTLKQQRRGTSTCSADEGRARRGAAQRSAARCAYASARAHTCAWALPSSMEKSITQSATRVVERAIASARVRACGVLFATSGCSAGKGPAVR